MNGITTTLNTNLSIQEIDNIKSVYQNSDSKEHNIENYFIISDSKPNAKTPKPFKEVIISYFNHLIGGLYYENESKLNVEFSESELNNFKESTLMVNKIEKPQITKYYKGLYLYIEDVLKTFGINQAIFEKERKSLMLKYHLIEDKCFDNHVFRFTPNNASLISMEYCHLILLKINPNLLQNSIYSNSIKVDITRTAELKVKKVFKQPKIITPYATIVVEECITKNQEKYLKIHNKSGKENPEKIKYEIKLAEKEKEKGLPLTVVKELLGITKDMKSLEISKKIPETIGEFIIKTKSELKNGSLDVYYSTLIVTKPKVLESKKEKQVEFVKPPQKGLNTEVEKVNTEIEKTDKKIDKIEEVNEPEFDDFDEENVEYEEVEYEEFDDF